MALVDSPEIEQLYYQLFKISDDMELFVDVSGILMQIETDDMLTMKDVHDMLFNVAVKLFHRISRLNIAPPYETQGAGGDGKC